MFAKLTGAALVGVVLLAVTVSAEAQQRGNRPQRSPAGGQNANPNRGQNPNRNRVPDRGQNRGPNQGQNRGPDRGAGARPNRPTPSFSGDAPRRQMPDGMVTTRNGRGDRDDRRPNRPPDRDRRPPGFAPSNPGVPPHLLRPNEVARRVQEGRRPFPGRWDAGWNGGGWNGGGNWNGGGRPGRPAVVNRPVDVDVRNRVTNITNNIQNTNQNITIVNDRDRYPGVGVARPWYDGWYQGGWDTAVQPPNWVNLPAGGGWFVNSAQAGFVNPFWSAGQTVSAQYLDYSHRLNVSQQTGFPSPSEAVNQERALARVNEARELFSRGDYSGALTRIEEAIALVPDDPPLHEFRALALFALGRFTDSAGGLYAVLSSSPGWDSATLRALYGNLDDYAAHLRNLEQFLEENPDSPEGHFLFAYHLAGARQYEASLAELDIVQNLLPDDALVAQLREVLRNSI